MRFRRYPKMANDLVGGLERFGRSSYNAVDAPWPWPSAATEFILPMYWQYQADPAAFLSTLADLAESMGGWAAYGAERLMSEVADGNLADPAYGRLMNASLSFMRASGIPPMLVTGYEWGYWIDQGGTNETWVARRPIPGLDLAPIPALHIGQSRRIAQLWSDAASAVYLVRCDKPALFSWIIDTPQSDEDPTRAQFAHQTADSLYQIYVRVGLSLQIPPYWHEPELEPYIPLPAPAFTALS